MMQAARTRSTTTCPPALLLGRTIWLAVGGHVVVRLAVVLLHAAVVRAVPGRSYPATPSSSTRGGTEGATFGNQGNVWGRGDTNEAPHAAVGTTRAVPEQHRLSRAAARPATGGIDASAVLTLCSSNQPPHSPNQKQVSAKCRAAIQELARQLGGDADHGTVRLATAVPHPIVTTVTTVTTTATVARQETHQQTRSSTIPTFEWAFPRHAAGLVAAITTTTTSSSEQQSTLGTLISMLVFLGVILLAIILAASVMHCIKRRPTRTGPMDMRATRSSFHNEASVARAAMIRAGFRPSVEDQDDSNHANEDVLLPNYTVHASDAFRASGPSSSNAQDHSQDHNHDHGAAATAATVNMMPPAYADSVVTVPGAVLTGIETAESWGSNSRQSSSSPVDCLGPLGPDGCELPRCPPPYTPTPTLAPPDDAESDLGMDMHHAHRSEGAEAEAEFLRPLPPVRHAWSTQC